MREWGQELMGHTSVESHQLYLVHREHELAPGSLPPRSCVVSHGAGSRVLHQIWSVDLEAGGIPWRFEKHAWYGAGGEAGLKRLGEEQAQEVAKGGAGAHRAGRM